MYVGRTMAVRRWRILLIFFFIPLISLLFSLLCVCIKLHPTNSLSHTVRCDRRVIGLYRYSMSIYIR